MAGASEASPGHIYKDLPKGLRAVERLRGGRRLKAKKAQG